jgi:hypothetical protein
VVGISPLYGNGFSHGLLKKAFLYIKESGRYQGCGAGTRTGQNRNHLGTPELYSEYGSGFGNKEMKQKLKKM